MKTLNLKDEFKKWQNRLEGEKVTLDEFLDEYTECDAKETGILLEMLLDEHLEYAAQDSGYSKVEIAEAFFTHIWEESSEPIMNIFEHVYGVAMEHDL